MTTTDATTATTNPEGTEMTQTDPKGATAPEGTTDPAETGEGQQSTGNREAANYRTKLRAAEAERDALAATVEGYRRAEVEALVGDKLLSAPDLWTTGVKVGDLLTEDGRPDPAKVLAAVKQVLAERPHWSGRKSPDTGQGRSRGGADEPGGSGGVRSMQQILRDA